MDAKYDPLLGKLRTSDSYDPSTDSIHALKAGDTFTGQVNIDYENPLIRLVEAGSGNTFDFQQYSYGTYLRANNSGMTIETANFSNVTFNVAGGTGNGIFSILSAVQVTGTIGTAIRIVTTSTSYGKLDGTIVGNSASAITATLEDASVQAGRMYTFKNINTGTMTVATVNSQTIDGSTTYDLSQWQSITVQSTGSSFIIIGKV